jgi:hypothetical protein
MNPTFERDLASASSPTRSRARIGTDDRSWRRPVATTRAPITASAALQVSGRWSHLPLYSPKPHLAVCTLPANGRVDAEVSAGAVALRDSHEHAELSGPPQPIRHTSPSGRSQRASRRRSNAVNLRFGRCAWSEEFFTAMVPLLFGRRSRRPIAPVRYRTYWTAAQSTRKGCHFSPFPFRSW